MFLWLQTAYVEFFTLHRTPPQPPWVIYYCHVSIPIIVVCSGQKVNH